MCLISQVLNPLPPLKEELLLVIPWCSGYYCYVNLFKQNLNSKLCAVLMDIVSKQLLEKFNKFEPLENEAMEMFNMSVWNKNINLL